MSDVTIRQVIVAAGYGADPSKLDPYFSDKERDVQQEIQAAEDEIGRLTGRMFTSGSADWYYYNKIVKKLAAKEILSTILNSSSTDQDYELEGAFKIDKSGRSRSLRSTIMRLNTDVKEGIETLKLTETSPLRTVVRRRI